MVHAQKAAKGATPHLIPVSEFEAVVRKVVSVPKADVERRLAAGQAANKAKRGSGQK